MEENKATKLKNVSTNDLIKELESRDGIEKTTTGLYEPYTLKKKYVSENREEISAVVLIIKHYLLREGGAGMRQLSDERQQKINNLFDSLCDLALKIASEKNTTGRDLEVLPAVLDKILILKNLVH